MKTSAGLLSLALVLALPAAAQRASSSGGSHSSGGSSSHGSASSASSGSSGTHATHSSYASSSSSTAGTHAQSSGSSSGAQASGRYVGSAPAQRQAPIVQRSYVPARVIGSQTVAAASRIVRASAHPQTAPRAPYITSVLVPQPGQGFNFGIRPGSHHGFHNSFCGSSFGFGFNCFGGSFFSPFLYPLGLGYGAGLYFPNSNYGYSSGDQVVDYSSDYQPPSAPGTYMPDALTPAQPEESPAPLPVTLLELKDGTMYGVTDYWLDHGQLRYVPVYGGLNSVPLERVDIDKTVELNSAKGLGFNLRTAPSARPKPEPSFKPLEPAAIPELPL